MTTLARLINLLLLSATVCLASPLLALADDDDGQDGRVLKVDCDKGKTITKALERARPGDTIQIKGTCQEKVRIRTDRVSLVGLHGAVVDGGGGEPTVFDGVIDIDSVQGVNLEGLTVQNGRGTGILAQNGAAFAAKNVIARDNATAGMFVNDNSTAYLTDLTFQRSGRLGLVVQNNSTAVLKGTISSTDNAVNGIAVQTRSVLEARGASVQATNNGRNGFDIVDSSLVTFGFPGQESTLIADENGDTGIFIALGSLQVFGGDPGAYTINASNNGSNGIQLVDAGRIVSPSAAVNVIVEDNPVGLNFGDGTGALIIGGLAVRNNGTGLLADGADTSTLVSVPPNPSSIKDNIDVDVDLKFGSRARIINVAVGFLVCDATVLLAGTTGFTCPTL